MSTAPNGFWSTVGNNLANKSLIGDAVYQGITGHAPTDQPGQNPAVSMANSIIAKYRRSTVDPSATMTGPNPTPVELNQPLAPMPAYQPQDPSMGAEASNPAAAQESPWNQPDQSTNKNGGGLLNVGGLIKAGAGVASAATGMIAPYKTMARIGEAGPEAAGGRIISSPTIVKLEKGESVIPLTPRPTNKLQPDLLEGHLAHPQPQGVQYSRYKQYGTGRGLMK